MTYRIIISTKYPIYLTLNNFYSSLPMSPLGLIAKVTTKALKANSSVYSVDRKAIEKVSIAPIKKPPMIAPGILPMPPIIIIANAFSKGGKPISELTKLTCPSKIPAQPAKALPRAKVKQFIRFAFIPTKAAPLSL
jgi:hypothetical protein